MMWIQPLGLFNARNTVAYAILKGFLINVLQSFSLSVAGRMS